MVLVNEVRNEDFIRRYIYLCILKVPWVGGTRIIHNDILVRNDLSRELKHVVEHIQWHVSFSITEWYDALSCTCSFRSR